MEGYPKHPKLMLHGHGTGVGVSTPFLAPCISSHVQETGVDSLGSSSEHWSPGPELPHTALQSLFRATLVSTHLGSC